MSADEDNGLEKVNEASSSDDESEDTELHPFMEVTGLDINIWPAWGPLPSRKTFYPYFSAQIRDDEKKHSFVTTLSLPDLVQVCAQLAHIIKISARAAQNIGPSKIDIYKPKEKIIKDLNEICSDLGVFLKAIKEDDIIFDDAAPPAEKKEEQ
ncbi:hypothetical protein [Bradyrhizobium sp. SZCCHNS3052]|uniref:hypothetical protein n=1 Tax=Bradyrhizobium sp. SZCCHNS3052 TaxID=3057321 RepID=UPI002916786C|nr:hypothetical protein [Bradyrhizobium sp. SZCCHNS3052]